MPLPNTCCFCLHNPDFSFTEMFKLFFVFTLFSAILLWYCHEYHTDKFLQVFRKISFSNTITNQIHLLFSSSLSLSSRLTHGKLFTSDELKQYNGEKDSKGIYLAILGEVYDVGKGQKHYGPGGPYHIFAGKDASRSFVTGDFDSTSPVDDVLDLSHSELLGLRDWLKFYKKEYEYKGILIGRYYDEAGKRTKYYEELNKKFDEAEKNQKVEKNEELLFPPCNVEWNAETGTKVWCTNKSGGIQRNWVGVPRKLYMVGSESYRCACVDLTQIQKTDSPQYSRRGHLQQYENCNPMNHSCFIRE